MSEASDTLINNLNNRINELADGKAKACHDAKSRRLELRDEQAKTAELAKQLAALTADRDGWKTKAEAGPSDLQKKVDDLTGKLLERDHRDAFRRLAKEANVNATDQAIDDLWVLSGYKAETPEIDDALIKGVIETTLKDRPHLAGQGSSPTSPAGSPAGKPAIRPPLAAAAEASRGARDTTANQVRVSGADLRNPALASRNQKAIAEAQAAGHHVVITD